MTQYIRKASFRAKERLQVRWHCPPKEWLTPNKAVSSPAWDVFEKEQGQSVQDDMKTSTG